MKDTVNIKGYVVATLRNLDGEIVYQDEVENTFVQNGQTLVAQALSGLTTNVGINHMGLGSGLAAANETDTALGSAYQGATATDAYDLNLGMTSAANASVTFQGSWAGAGIQMDSVAECALYNSTNGSMFARALFSSSFNKGTDQTLTVNYTIGL